MPKWRATSRSWASCDGIIAMGMPQMCESFEPLAEILECRVEIRGENIFGEVKSSHIKMRAHLVSLILNPRVDLDGTGIHTITIQESG